MRARRLIAVALFGALFVPGTGLAFDGGPWETDASGECPRPAAQPALFQNTADIQFTGFDFSYEPVA